jgi:hypothetical protein
LRVCVRERDSAPWPWLAPRGPACASEVAQPPGAEFVCVREREKEGARVCVCACVRKREYVGESVCVCLRVCEREIIFVCVFATTCSWGLH